MDAKDLTRYNDGCTAVEIFFLHPHFCCSLILRHKALSMIIEDMKRFSWALICLGYLRGAVDGAEYGQLGDFLTSFPMSKYFWKVPLCGNIQRSS